MNARLAFDRLVHSDWSVSPQKRWTATAVRSSDGWLVAHLKQTQAPEDFVDYLFNCSGPTLAGFDFPIGLPSFYVMKTGFDLRHLICSPGCEQARRFLTPVETLFEISPDQPFYRKHPKGGGHAILFERLGCRSISDLLRECDKKTHNRNRAEAIFWTVGPKQVGKAALAGWVEILVPVLRRGAGLWPFDGMLASQVSNKLTIAETYPAEAYKHIGMAGTIKKRSQTGRKTACNIMLEWASKHGVRFVKDIEVNILNGFGASEAAEDPFDAIAGLCGMIEVVDGRRAEAPNIAKFVKLGEGWILGQLDTPLDAPEPFKAVLSVQV